VVVVTVGLVGVGQLLFLADGRVFVRRADGEAADAERENAYFVLDFLEAVPLHPSQGLAISPPSTS